MNKRRNLLFGVLFFSSSIIFGQTNKINIGFEGGPSSISLRGNDMVESYEDLSFGFSSGLSFQYNLSKLLSLRTNISFERKGFATKIQTTDEEGSPIGEFSYHSDFDFLVIPLLTRLTFGKKNHFYVNAGPYLGYLLKQQSIRDSYGEYPKIKSNDTDLYKRLDFGLTNGIGANYPIREKFMLTAEIRHNLGLLNISSLPVVNDGSIKTNSTIIIIGIAYSLGNMNQ